MRSRAIPKLFFVICLIVFVVILFMTMLNVEEAEVPGWEYNISRNLDTYIHHNVVTATILPKDFCDSPTFLVVMCISSPSGFEARKVIRQTWGSQKSVLGVNISLYFLLGQTLDGDLQKNITEESDLFQDIVQESFHDSYNNLTIKSAMMLKLFSQNCQKSAKFLLKIDDDIYLNVPMLVEDLVTRNQTQDLLMGSVICGSKPIRSANDKWYAGPSYFFPYNTYPKYVSGTSYCMSGDVAGKLLKAALETPVFHLEDVYLTGICAKKLSLKLTHNGRFTFHALKKNYCLYRPMITIHYQQPNDIQKIHESIDDPKMNEQCLKQDQAFMVHKWLMENVLMINKTRRKRKCF